MKLGDDKHHTVMSTAPAVQQAGASLNMIMVSDSWQQ